MWHFNSKVRTSSVTDNLRGRIPSLAMTCYCNFGQQLMSRLVTLVMSTSKQPQLCYLCPIVIVSTYAIVNIKKNLCLTLDFTAEMFQVFRIQRMRLLCKDVLVAIVRTAPLPNRQSVINDQDLYNFRQRGEKLGKSGRIAILNLTKGVGSQRSIK